MPYADIHKYKQYQREYRQRNKAKANQALKEWNSRNLLPYLFRTAKARARKTGIDFTIEMADIDIPDVCPVFGTQFERNTPYAASIDRIDNSKGYVPGNVQVLSRRANQMKNDANEEELKLFAIWILSDEEI